MGYGKNEAQVKKLISSLPKDYQEPVDVALRTDRETELDSVWEKCKDLNERTALAEIYLQSRDYYDKIQSSKSIWKHVFEDLGFNEQDNPFMTLLNNLNWDYMDSIPEESARQVFNSYVNGVIDKEDLKDKESIVYNPNLYTKIFSRGERESAEYLNDWVKFRPKVYREKMEREAQRPLSDSEIKNFIFFGSFVAKPNSGILLPYTTVQNLKTKYESISDEESRAAKKSNKIDDLLKYDTKAEAISKMLKSMSDTERSEVLKAILDTYKGDIQK